MTLGLTLPIPITPTADWDMLVGIVAVGTILLILKVALGEKKEKPDVAAMQKRIEELEAELAEKEEDETGGTEK